MVHGSTQDITEEEIAEVRDAVISLVSSFIMNEKLSKMTSIEEVADWINNLKFAGISEDHVHCEVKESIFVLYEVCT